MYNVKVFDRDMYPGGGDPITQLWHDINAWGAYCAVHVHQDAGGYGRGYTTLYRKSKEFAYIMDKAFDEVVGPYDVPDRNLMYFTRAGVLNNANMPALISECGFYTSPEDEAIGVETYAQAIALAVRRFAPPSAKVAIASSLQGPPEECGGEVNTHNIAHRVAEILLTEMTEEKGEDMLPCPVQREHVFPDIWLETGTPFELYYLICKEQGGKASTFTVIAMTGTEAPKPVYVFDSKPFARTAIDLKTLLKNAGYENRSVAVTVQSTELSAVYVREA
jgi:hypothetical protein